MGPGFESLRGHPNLRKMKSDNAVPGGASVKRWSRISGSFLLVRRAITSRPCI